MEPIATFRTARALARMVGLAPIAAKEFAQINITMDQTVPAIALVHPPTLNCNVLKKNCFLFQMKSLMIF